MVSLLWDVVMVLVVPEIWFRGAQIVSNTFPSTLPAPGTYLVEYLG